MTNGGMAEETKVFTEGDAPQSEQFRAEGVDPKFGAWGFTRLGLGIPNPLNIPAWGSRQRDIFLRNTVRNSTIFAAVVYGESVRVQNTEYGITSEDKDEADLTKYQEMLQTCDFGNGYAVFSNKIAQDLLTQDNGAFIELIGDNRDSEQPLTGLPSSFAHIDSGQVWRTFSSEWPIIYINPFTNEQRVFHWSRVVMLSSMPQAYELGRGIGLCAMSRAYETGRIVLATNQYVYEKVTGGAPDIHISNIPFDGLKTAVMSSLMDAKDKDYQIFQDPIVMSPLSGGVGAAELSLDVMSLKNMPDGFDHEKELTLAVYMVAAGFGVDAREYWPATASGATKADAEIQDVKGEAKGRAEILNLLETTVNWRIFPAEVTLEYRRQNALTDMREALNRQTRVDTRATQIISGELNVDEARRMAAADGDIDPAFLEEAEFADDTTAAEGTTQDTQEESEPEPPDEEEAPAEEEQPLAEKMTMASKNYGTIRNSFSRRLFTEINRLRRTGDVANFIPDAARLLQTMGQRAFLAGVQDGGAPDVRSIGRLEPEESAAMQTAINTQMGFLSRLGVDFEDNSDATFASIRSRVSLWANKGLDSIYYAGVLAGRSNPNMLWSLGATEKHCRSCEGFNGRVYRKKIWAKYEIEPRSSLLECKGFHCDCTLEITKQPVTPGRPPNF